MMPMSSHGPAPAEPIIVEIEGIGELEFPGDTDPSVIQAKVKELTAKNQDFSQFGPMQGMLKDQANRDTLREDAKANAPAIGAMVGSALAGPLGVIPATMVAAGSGYLGGRVRGDDRATAVGEGLKQGALQAGTAGAAKLASMVAPTMYRVGIPKAIKDKFRKADLAGSGLSNRVVLGTERGADRAKAANAAAGKEAEGLAHTAPDMTSRDIELAFSPKYNKALLGGKNQKAAEIGEHVADTTREMGGHGKPFTGRQQYARKEFLEQESGSAMTAPNPNMKPTNPRLANTERKAIAGNLRKSPEMAKALDKSQAAIGVSRAADATQNSTAFDRLANGGIWNALRSPAVFSGAGIAINEGGRALKLSPQAIRLLDLILQGEEPE
jgi:hypothetical protein